MTTRYFRGDAIDQLIARIDGSTPRWYLADEQGSINQVIDSAGAVKDALTYDAWGNILTETNSTERGRYAWTGREVDTEIALQFNRARYYDPTTGRWITQDPLGFDAGDSNLYRYVSNGATDSTDPSGLQQVVMPSNDQILHWNSWTVAPNVPRENNVIIRKYTIDRIEDVQIQKGGANPADRKAGLEMFNLSYTRKRTEIIITGAVVMKYRVDPIALKAFLETRIGLNKKRDILDKRIDEQSAILDNTFGNFAAKVTSIGIKVGRYAVPIINLNPFVSPVEDIADNMIREEDLAKPNLNRLIKERSDLRAHIPTVPANIILGLRNVNAVVGNRPWLKEEAWFSDGGLKVQKTESNLRIMGRRLIWGNVDEKTLIRELNRIDPIQNPFLQPGILIEGRMRANLPVIAPDLKMLGLDPDLEKNGFDGVPMPLAVRKS